MIVVDQVSKYFGTAKAVDDVSLTVAEGETLILLGTSGCGKATTLRMINRLLERCVTKVSGTPKNLKLIGWAHQRFDYDGA